MTMKTIYDRDPEFSMTYTHAGLSVTFSSKVLTKDYLTTSGSDQENEEHLHILFSNSLQEVIQQAAAQLTKSHSLFDEALAKAYLDQIRSRPTPSNTNGINKNPS